MELNQVTLAVSDVTRSVGFYERLGFRRIVDAPHYARFECRPGGPSFSVHFAEAGASDSSVVVYFECDDLDKRVQELRLAGIQFETDPTDEPWLWREAYLRDPDGHRLCLYHAGRNRLHPPWRIGAPILGFALEGIDHVALAVRDIKASVQWYEDVLGLKRLYQQAWGDYPAVVGVGTTSVALFPVETDAPQPSPGRNVLATCHIAFRADSENFARVQRELTRRHIAFEFQDHDIAHSIYLHDPNGHEIEITTYDLKRATQVSDA
jgi:catechol 2,3-dioxygenase-like lactoylglutathione lyase family enzyme